MSFMNLSAGAWVRLPGRGNRPNQVHIFEDKAILAVDAALAAQRPLLVRGEPGCGKSQLARAVAKHLGRMYVQRVVDSSTEAQDLLWRYDAVARLADAQLHGQAQALPRQRRPPTRRLEMKNYVHPGPLWWAFDWQDAAHHAAHVGDTPPPQDRPEPNQTAPCPTNGSVVLIDEIDKAESEVPNGLLEALGMGEFTPLGRKYPVVATGQPALVIITTNNERALPDAFLRRCLVLQLALPTDDEALKHFLIARGEKHFANQTNVAVLTEAAVQLIQDRAWAKKHHHFPLPGQAEYLDLLRAVIELSDGVEEQSTRLKQLSEFAYRKHPRVSP